jgi:shikimate kinase
MLGTDSIFLIGPMGSGKSAVGRRLARDLSRTFIDSDDVIEERTGVDIPYIFEKEGEAGFRVRECEAIDHLTAQNGIVLATGGGTVIDADNRRRLSDRGTVIFLHTSVTEQLRRTTRGRERPLLKQGEPGEVLDRLMQSREPLYREIAQLIVETDGRTVTSVVKEIRKWLKAEVGES